MGQFFMQVVMTTKGTSTPVTTIITGDESVEVLSTRDESSDLSLGEKSQANSVVRLEVLHISESTIMPIDENPASAVNESTRNSVRQSTNDIIVANQDLTVSIKSISGNSKGDGTTAVVTVRDSDVFNHQPSTMMQPIQTQIVNNSAPIMTTPGSRDCSTFDENIRVVEAAQFFKKTERSLPEVAQALIHLQSRLSELADYAFKIEHKKALTMS